MRIATYVIISFLLLGWACKGWTSERLTVKQVEKICERYNYHNCKLVASIAVVESDLNPSAYNESEDAIGLLQIKCVVAKRVGLKYDCKQLFSPRINIRFAIKLLESLERRGFIMERHLIASYNAGKPKYCRRMKKNRWLGGGVCLPGSLINELYIFKVTRVLEYLRREG